MANPTRDDIALLQEQIALLEQRAIAEKNYGRGVKRDQEGRQDRIAAYNKTLDEIMSKEKEMIGIQKSQRDIGKQLGDIQKQYGDNILKQFGLEDSISTLKDASKANDAEQLRQVGQLSNILDSVLKGEMDALDVREAAVGLTGKVREQAEAIADTIENTPDLQKKFALKAELFQKFDGLFGGIASTIRGILAATGPIGLLMAGIGILLNYLIETVKRGVELRRELGTSVVETARLSVNMEAAALASARFGGSMQAGRDAVKDLVSETGNLEDINLANSAALGKLVANTGMAGSEAAKLLKAMKLVNGQSIATNVNTLLAADNLAESRGVLSSKVFSDLASNTELFARAGAAGAQSLSKAAVEAAKIGTSLSALDQIADNLLDVQATIRRSQQLSRLLGRNIDLTRAISLANDPTQIGALRTELQNQFAGVDISRNRFVQNQLKQLFPSLQDFNAIVNGEVQQEEITPPAAKDSLEAQNSTNEILTKQSNDIKLLREQNKELLEKLNGSIKQLRR